MRILLSTTVSALLMCSALAQTEDDRISATGSGFFVTPDGYFITNDHVIRGAATVRIVQNGNKINAKIIRTDPANDLAVLKADGEFVFVRLGASRNVRLGQNVFTIGFPNPQIQGVAPKLTTGVISATTGIRDDPRLLQISIPVQPGNSGGPVIDENGDAVGVVSASLSALGLLRMSGSLPQNVNYAVKSSYVTALLEDVLPAETSRESASAAHNQAEIMAAAEKAVALVLSYAAPSRKSAVATDKEDRPPLSEAPPEVAANPHLGT
jgi:S1-C subfamily serine protease